MHAYKFIGTEVIIPVSHVEKEKTGREDNNEDNINDPKELIIVHGALSVSHRHLFRPWWFNKPQPKEKDGVNQKQVFWCHLILINLMMFLLRMKV